jgi:riboflavin synthase
VGFAADLALGESVSINGTCLTVVKQDHETFQAQVTPTTLALTTLGHLNPGDKVNLERSVTPATRLGGHWVLGHVDGVGRIESIEAEGDSHHVLVRYPSDHQRWVLPQGSITIDGISLTVVKRAESQLGVTVIPHTWTHTIAQYWKPGAAVNLEFDVLGKYVEQLTAPYRDIKEE